MSVGYWTRVFSGNRRRRTFALHFTRRPNESVVMVALANQRPHDLILLPPNASNQTVYRMMRDYAKALTSTEILNLSLNRGVGAPTPIIPKETHHATAQD